LPANRREPETYTIDETIRVPVLLRDEEGVAHVRAIFRRMRRPGNLGPRGLDPGQFGRSEEFAFLGLLPYWVANIIFYGFGEEIGWRGFALPRLQTGRRSVLTVVCSSARL
jgi:Type II CAAX prenyl endopeptidase Rce1-like